MIPHRVTSDMLNLNKHILDGFIVQDNTPQTGYISWSDLYIVYKGVKYGPYSGNTNLKYVWWEYANPNSLWASNTFPALTDDDVLIFLNKLGIHLTVPKATIIDGSLIVPESIYSQAIAANAINSINIAAGAITADKIAANAVGASAIAAGAITADKIAAKAITAHELNIELTDENLLVDSSFEFNQWYKQGGYGNIEYSIGTNGWLPRSGNQFLRVNSAGTQYCYARIWYSNDGGLSFFDIDVDSSTEYTLSFYYSIVSLDSDRYATANYSYIQFLDISKNVISSLQIPLNLSTGYYIDPSTDSVEWDRTSITFTTPNNCCYIRLQLGVMFNITPLAGYYFCVDDMMLTRGGLLHTYKPRLPEIYIDNAILKIIHSGGGVINGSLTLNGGFNSTGGNINGDLTINGGGGALKLKPASDDHVYIEYYADTQNPATRSGWIGYGGAGTSDLTIQNQMTNGNINLITNGNGKVNINGYTAWHAGNDSAVIIPYFYVLATSVGGYLALPTKSTTDAILAYVRIRKKARYLYVQVVGVSDSSSVTATVYIKVASVTGTSFTATNTPVTRVYRIDFNAYSYTYDTWLILYAKTSNASYNAGARLDVIFWSDTGSESYNYAITV